MPTLAWPSLLLVLGLFGIWLCRLARRIRKRPLRWCAVGVAAVLTVASCSLGVMAAAGTVKLKSRHAPVPHPTIARSREQVERGHAIADSFCAVCHSRFGALSGGQDIGAEISVPIGAFVPPNLTPGGPLQYWSDGQIFRAIRNGLGANDNWLMIMSYTNVSKLSDADIKALIAYMRTLPVSNIQTMDPPDRLSLIGLILLGAGMLPAGGEINNGTITAPAKAPTVQYGEYILSYQDCRSCHGADLRGGVPGQLAVIGPALDMVKNWTPAEFRNTLRTGSDPSGRRLDSRKMPWDFVGRMDDEELGAIYAYLTR